MGAEPTGVDATMFAFVAGVLCPAFDTPIRTAAERHDNLKRYVGRMTARFYPELGRDRRLQGGSVMRRGSDRELAQKTNPRHEAGGYGKTLAGRMTGLPATSGHLEILRRCLAAIGHELVLDSLSFVERAEARALDRRDMDEHVLVAGRRLE